MLVFLYTYSNPNYNDIKTESFARWRADDRLGAFQRGKAFRPDAFGETKANPIITVLLCRAWALWRMTRTEWHRSDAFAASEFQREEASLVKDIQDLRAIPPCLLGNGAGDYHVKYLAPQVVALVRP